MKSYVSHSLVEALVCTPYSFIIVGARAGAAGHESSTGWSMWSCASCYLHNFDHEIQIVSLNTDTIANLYSVCRRKLVHLLMDHSVLGNYELLPVVCLEGGAYTMIQTDPPLC